MFNAIRKFLKRLAWTVAILVVAALILAGLLAPKLIINLGGCALIVGCIFLLIFGFSSTVESKDFMSMTDPKQRRRYRHNWF